MRDDYAITPHITNDQWCELTIRLTHCGLLQYREPLLKLLKRVILNDESMEVVVSTELPQIVGLYYDWGNWIIKHCRWVSDAPDERLIWVDGIWCGTGLVAKIIQPRQRSGEFQVVVTDDDDWIEHSAIYPSLEAARLMLSRIERCDTLLTLHSTLTSHPTVC